jgi:hypothetical protein
MATANPWLSGAGFDAYRSAGWRYLGIVLVFLVLAVEIVARASGAGAPAVTSQGVSSYVNKPVPASLVRTLNVASQAGLTFSGGPKSLSIAVKASSATGAVKGGPTWFYQGANFCPYCGAARWAMIVALMRFGQFSGLKYMASNPNDVFPNTPTFTFDSAKYTSTYLHFDSAEVVNRTDTAALQTPSAANNAAFKAYDTSKYVGQAAGTIPFIDVANRYVWVGAPYDPTQINKMLWPAIANDLVTAAKTGKGESNILAILENANMYTAAICSADGEKPAAVCNASGVVAARGDLPK